MNTQILERQADLLDGDFLADIQARLLARGASDVVVSAGKSRSLSLSVRGGEFQDVSHEEGGNLTLKAYVGKRMAAVSTNDPSPQVVDTMCDRVIRMAQLASEDPHAGLPDRSLLVPVTDDAALEMVDPGEPDLARFESDALELESHALEVPGVSASQGASLGWSMGENLVIASNGFSMKSTGTQFNAGVGVLAGEGDVREMGGFGHAARWREDLWDLKRIGSRAGQFASEKLGSRKIDSCRAPVIFEQRASFAIVNSFLGAISGNGLYHKQTYLDDPLGKQVFAKGFSLIEDPFRRRGLASRVKDGDGMAAFDGAIVDDGTVQTLLISFYDSRRLDIPSTGHSGGMGNLTVLPGELGLEGLMGAAGSGLIVTGIMGSSADPYSGDFSMGVSGLWFEGGEIAYPVSEITIAGNFKEIFADLLVGSDLEDAGPRAAPSLLVSPLMIGGK